MSEEKREREVPSEVKASARKRSDHPLLQFSRSMREFRGGIAELRRVAEKIGQPRSNTNVRTIERAGRPSISTIRTIERAGRSAAARVTEKAGRTTSSTARAAEKSSRTPGSIVRADGKPGRVASSPEGKQKADRHTLPESGRHIGRSSNIGQALRQLAGATPKLPYFFPHSSPSPLRDTIAWRHVYGPEDQEAVKHLSEQGSSGTFEDLPRAARVAMILRADEIARDEGKQDRIVGHLASSVRSGKPEVAANFSPRRLERVLSNLLGGKQGAMQALWTPEVARIVERYQTERKVVQEKLQTLERGLPEGEAGSIRGPEASVPALGAASTGGSAVSAPRAEGRAIDALFRRNDLLHLGTHSENRRKQLLEQTSVARSEHALPEATAGGRRAEIALPSEGTPAARSGAGGAGATKDSRKSDDRRRLEGTLTLMGGNGEALGSAILKGSDRNG